MWEAGAEVGYYCCLIDLFLLGDCCFCFCSWFFFIYIYTLELEIED